MKYIGCTTLSILVFCINIAHGVGEEPNDPFRVDVYKAGDNGFHTYRIPSLLVTPSGALLAFAEARKNGAGDHGHLEVVVRRSEDHGKFWGPIEVVASDGTHAVQNPTGVVDRNTGTLWICLIRTDAAAIKTQSDIRESKVQVRRTWIVKSEDDGRTWSDPRDITESVCAPERLGCIPGPGAGIQLSTGRLLFPMYSRGLEGKPPRAFAVYSDDAGKTWEAGESTDIHMDECQVVELADETLLLNMRSYRKKSRRAIAKSKDGGQTWSEVSDDPTLIEPVCQASFIRYTRKPEFAKDRLLFSNPAREKHDDRNEMTVRLSYDEGKTWPVAKVLEPGFSGYSSLAVLPDFSMGCLHETKRERKYDTITFSRFTLEWLTDGADSLRPG